jgi:hypothetical protein
MPTGPLSTTGLPMPEDLEISSYESIASRLAPLHSTYPVAWPEYAGGWVALGYRFRACAEYDESFVESLRQHGGYPPPAERHGQERDLYGFFVSGLSAVECFCYGLFAIASMLRSDRFPIQTDDEKRAINPQMVTDKFASVFPGEPVTQELSVLMGDQNYREWKDIRNMLAHRASPGRHHSITVPPGRDTSAWGNLILDEHVTADRRRWLAGTLRSLLRATATFTAPRF